MSLPIKNVTLKVPETVDFNITKLTAAEKNSIALEYAGVVGTVIIRNAQCPNKPIYNAGMFHRDCTSDDHIVFPEIFLTNRLVPLCRHWMAKLIISESKTTNTVCQYLLHPTKNNSYSQQLLRQGLNTRWKSFGFSDEAIVLMHDIHVPNKFLLMQTLGEIIHNPVLLKAFKEYPLTGDTNLIRRDWYLSNKKKITEINPNLLHLSNTRCVNIGKLIEALEQRQLL